MNLKDLTKEIPYKWRKGPGNTNLPYIDARDVMNLLDSVCSPENWQKDYKVLDGKMYCGIGIFINDQWVWKWDMGTESDFEAEKGEASDAFKRAGVSWGIGRFLYDIDPKKQTFSQLKSSAKKEADKMVKETKEPWTSLSYTHTKPKEELDDLVITDEMLGGEEEIKSCPICGAHISKKEIDYCKSKGIPPACYNCQKGTNIVSQKPALDKVYASERKSK